MLQKKYKQRNTTTHKTDKIKILVCYHKPYEFPKEDIYLPIQAGKAISAIDLGIQGDNTGDHISEKNRSFCELTVLYWAWKNIKKLYPDIEYVGLSHYRRLFALDKPFEGYTEIRKNSIPENKNYEDLIKQKLENNDIILVKPAMLGLNMKDIYTQRHNFSDYQCMKDIIHEIYPEYDRAFLQFFENNNVMSSYCMFITRYEIFNKYCEWIFSLLFEAEKRIDISEYDAYQTRVFGFLAERLLNIYVRHNKLRIIYEPIYFVNDNYYNSKMTLRKAIKFFLPYGLVEYWRRIKK